MTRSLLSLAGAALAAAWPALAGAEAIKDNSFLIEEAYNQEPGVIQHISTFARQRGGSWLFTFTEEWPAGGQADQLSLTASALKPGPDGKAGAGDLLVNYRRQLVGDDEAAVALAPRLSLLLPTGDAARGRGAGGVGLQANLPLSVQLSPAFVTHVNLGGTWVPSARVAGVETRSWGWAFGQSLVWLLHPSLNLMLEALASSTETTAGGLTVRTETFDVAPGVRVALNLPGDLQVVVGLAAPLGVGPSHGERALFAYLSFEHPFFLAGPTEPERPTPRPIK